MSIDSIFDVIEKLVVRSAAILDRGQINRKIMHYGTMWLTFDSYMWAKAFAEANAGKAGYDIPLTIAAVLGAISTLQAVVFNTYVKSGPGVVRPPAERPHA